MNHFWTRGEGNVCSLDLDVDQVYIDESYHALSFMARSSHHYQKHPDTPFQIDPPQICYLDHSVRLHSLGTKSTLLL